MSSAITRLENQFEYIAYVADRRAEWDNEDTEVYLTRYADARLISEKERMQLWAIAGYVPIRLRPRPIVINNFHGCNVTIHSIGGLQ